jgi:hypothetical protein
LKNKSINLILCIYFLYLLWYPSIIFIYPDSAEISNYNNSYFIYFIYIFLLVIIVPISFFISKINFKSHFRSEVKREVYPKFYFKIAVGLFIAIFLFFINKIGVNLDTFFSRLNREGEDFINQSWVVFIIAAQAIIFTGIFLFEKLSKVDKRLLYLLIFIFIFFEVFLFAGRRNSLAIVLFILYKKGLINRLFSSYKGVAFFLFTIVFGLLFGVVREIIINPLIIVNGYDFNSITKLSLYANEFNEISRSLFNLIDRMQILNLEFGSTYLDSITIFIPRTLYQLKPISFVFRFDVAASPISEGYINFGILGFIPILILLTILRNVFKSSDKSFLSCVLIGYSFDIFRSNLSTLVYSLVIIMILYYILTTKRTAKSLI